MTKFALSSIMSEQANAKVVIVGDFAVGKTSLLNTFLTPEVIEIPEPTQSPIFHRKTVVNSVGESMTVNFWDTAGSERYQKLNPLFTRDSDIAIVCYLPQNTDNIDACITNVRQASNEVLLIAAVTKMDLIEGDAVACEAAEREARELRDRFGFIGIFFTSSIPGSKFRDEVTSLFGFATDRLANIETPTFTGNLVIGQRPGTTPTESPCC